MNNFKSIIFITAIVCMIFIALFLPKSANAGLWEKISTINLKTVPITSEYLVETAGWNIRVYEWTPANNTNIRCLFAGGSKKGGVSCYPIKH